MTESFISTKDRIISTAIDIISESGLSNLTTKTISAKANLSEPLLYRFYGDVNELLVDVVSYYFRFDRKAVIWRRSGHMWRTMPSIMRIIIHYLP